MSRRVFVNVTRGMTDKTAVCVFPWEIDVLTLVHGQDIKEVSIDDMVRMDGAVKVEKTKFKHSKNSGPTMRQQLEAMCYVAPDDDPCNDPAAEYNRLGEKYGMDKELPFACVTRIYGEFSSGAFTAKLKEYAADRAEKPAHLGADEDEASKAPADMSRDELRAQLKEMGIAFKVTEGRDALATKLEAALETA